ncbi:phytoene synthase [Arboricoccus pini]|uniref:Phytoene synthase n=1 Tax=Arboricoccus pini TaxID=1963835 RepID=A0A212QPX3_9PROT|nr:squalene/phytoene synthase family protein [Arboricoccus pini]SNB61490.1 phytoene synthase [Arboricoccus pini]
MASEERLSFSLNALEPVDFLLDEVRTRDPGRAICVILGAKKERQPLLALLLLDSELARVPRLITQPMAGYIRYQWWRDAITEIAAGQARQEPVLRALAPTLRAGRIDSGSLHALIDAHEAEMERVQSEVAAQPEAYAKATSGLLHRLLAEAAGTHEGRWLDAAIAVGTAHGLLAGRHAVPEEQRPDPAPLVGRALALLDAAGLRGRRPPRSAMPALLPALLVRKSAARLVRGLDDATVPRPVLGLVLANALRRI